MERKTQEPSIHEASSHTNNHVIHSNPYEQDSRVENANINRQHQERYEKLFNDPPPSYMTAVQSSTDPTHIQHQKPEFENAIQYTPLNNQEFHTHIHRWPRHSMNIVCPNCRATVNTRVDTNSTIVTILIAIILFLFCFCLVFLPFCIPACKKSIHYCPNCHSQLGEVREFQ